MGRERLWRASVSFFYNDRPDPAPKALQAAENLGWHRNCYSYVKKIKFAC